MFGTILNFKFLLAGVIYLFFFFFSDQRFGLAAVKVAAVKGVGGIAEKAAICRCKLARDTSSPARCKWRDISHVERAYSRF
jgi:hypothetical protein